MKSLIALLLTFGFFQFQIARAQDVSEPCPDEQTDTEMLEGEAKGEVEDQEFKLEEETDQSDLEIKGDEEETKIEYETDEFIYEEETDWEDGTVERELEQKDGEVETEMESDQLYEGSYEADATTDVVVVEEEDHESTLENIVEAPFKVGVTVVSETAEGVGEVGKGIGQGAARIIYSPIKGVAKLFRGEDDSDNM